MTKKRRTYRRSADPDSSVSLDSSSFEPKSKKRARHSSDEDWAPQLAVDTNQSTNNAPVKLESPAPEDAWETLETRTLAIDCSHVNLRANTIKDPVLCAELANAIFTDQVSGEGLVTLPNGLYSATLVPAVGTSLFMQVATQGDGAN